MCLPRPGLCPLAWGALVPLVSLWNRERPARAFAFGWLGGFAFHGVALYWIYSTCRFAGVAFPVAILAWGSLAGFLALHWGLVGALGAARWIPPGLKPWAWAVIWTGLSFAWGRWTPRLGADVLAYTQWRHLSLIQIGAVLGPHALGFLIVLVNAAAAQAWAGLDAGLPSRAVRNNLALAVLAVAAAWAWGRYALGSRPSSTPTARVEILQPNVDQYQKWDARYADRIDADFADLLARPRPAAPDLIVWPEAALPRLVEEKGVVAEAAASSRALKTFQMIGALTRVGRDAFNAAVLVGPDGAVRGVYHKRELVPFGEYVPLPFLRRFIGILNELGGVTAGAADQPLLYTPLGETAVSLCYEAMFPRWARFDAARGARILINLTNDGWYKDTWGPYQHFYANVFRAVENRATVIRAGNTGISGVIDPWGFVVARSELGARTRLDAVVPKVDAFPEGSYYSRHGDWLGGICLVIALGLLPLAWRAS